MSGENGIQLPNDYTASLLSFQKYPRFVVASSAYGPALLGIRERLILQQHRLFSKNVDKIVIPVREVNMTTDGRFQVTKRNLLTEAKVKEWIGDTSEQDPGDPTKSRGFLATKQDPLCRFIFLISDSALAPLELTRNALLRILAYHQVMPNYIDFLLVYGAHEEDRELRFSGFCARTILVDPNPGHVIPGLRRSGRLHEICYNLKAVGLQEANPNEPGQRRWKIRQSAIYHRFDLDTGTSLWVIGDPREAAKGVISEVLPEGAVSPDFDFGTVAECFVSALDTHWILAQWASNEWRSHIQSLERTIDDVTRPALSLDPGDKNQPRLGANSMVTVHIYEEKVTETIVSIESNIRTLTSLRSSYQTIVQDPDFTNSPIDSYRSAVKRFTTRISQLIDDLQAQLMRATTFLELSKERKAIIIQQLQIQSAYHQEMLANNMMGFSERGQKEAITMRIVTIITLLYLPPTFVSTFFSTDVVKYQDNGEDKVHFSLAAMNSFLYVTFPLWAITISVAVVYYRFENRRIKNTAREIQQLGPFRLRFTELTV